MTKEEEELVPRIRLSYGEFHPFLLGNFKLKKCRVGDPLKHTLLKRMTVFSEEIYRSRDYNRAVTFGNSVNFPPILQIYLLYLPFFVFYAVMFVLLSDNILVPNPRRPIPSIVIFLS